MNAHSGRSDDAHAEAETLFRDNLGLIERVILRVCHNAALYGADTEDFASTVKLALIENDYAVLRGWQQRASLGGYLTVVVQRLLSDERSRARGRFEPSAEARRGGKAAMLLESLVHRDGRPVEQAIPLVQAIDPSLTRADMEAMLARLPERTPRPRLAPIEDVDVESPRASDGAEASVADRETERLSSETSRMVRQALAALPQEDRTIVRMHFGSGTSIADISRMLRLPQRPLYRRIESALVQLRKALTAGGIDALTASGLIGSAVQSLDFDLAERDFDLAERDFDLQGRKNGTASRSTVGGGPNHGVDG